MQPTTSGIAAIRAMVRILGRDSEPFASPLVVAMFIRPTNTAESSSVPVPTFVSCCGGFVYECRNQRDTSKSRFLVEFWILHSLGGTCGYGLANVKSTPLGQPCDTYDLKVTFLTGVGVEKLENLAGAL